MLSRIPRGGCPAKPTSGADWRAVRGSRSDIDIGVDGSGLPLS
jgi:hypothetical protein